MELIITFLDGSHVVHMPTDSAVGDLKRLIKERFTVSTLEQKLSSQNGQTIELTDDSKTLSSYGLTSGSRIVVLIVKLVPIQVFLKNEKGQTHTYTVMPDETVEEFKQKVQNKENVPVDQQRLIHQGTQLDDQKKLADYGIKAESTIFLTLRLRGG